MRRPLLWIPFLCLLTVALAAGAARADGLPVLGIDVGGTGVVTTGGDARYVTIPAGGATVAARTSTADGRIVAARLLPGTFTIPAVAYDGSASGLSADGRTLVLIQPRVSFPRARTALMIVDARTLRPRQVVRLRGDFSFDAISPRGSLIYLIQYVSPDDPTRYLVRTYDLHAGRLLAKPVVDPRVPGEKMRGSPITRASSADGRWAYTLYDGSGKMPFVHALDTSTHAARCVDLEGLAGGELARLRIGLDPGGGTLTVSRGQRPLVAIDTRTFRVSNAVASTSGRGANRTGTPWALISLSSAAVLVAAGVLGRLHLRRRQRLAPAQSRS
jgi:hypothetical protein